MSAANGTDRKVIFLAMPAYSGPTMQAARAFYRASALLDVKLSYQQASLINSNCNAMWAWALNAAYRGRRIDYFALLHADVQPQDWWLDLLVAELERTGLDVLSVAVPIKDHKGLTSTALGDPDLTKFWRCHCRISMRELYDLPETFTAADCGHPDRPLLINTGCFVCRFDLAWARQVWFASNDRIVFDEARDCFQPEAEPEDWHFARRLHGLGLKVGVTRAVRLSHRGETDWANDQAWGDLDFDREYLDVQSIVAPEPPGGWRFPWDVEGWLSEEEGRYLANLAADKRVLEVGSYCGKSTICLAQGALSVHAVDTFDGRATPRQGPTLNRFRANLERHGVRQRVREFVGPASEVIPRLPGRGYDLVFIDGAHDLESVRHDAILAAGVLKSDGLLAFHDYREAPGQHDGRWDPGVTQTVNELVAAGGELINQVGTVAVVRPPARILEQVG